VPGYIPLRHHEHARLLSNIKKLGATSRCGTQPEAAILGSMRSSMLPPFLEPTAANRKFGPSVGTQRNKGIAGPLFVVQLEVPLNHWQASSASESEPAAARARGLTGPLSGGQPLASRRAGRSPKESAAHARAACTPSGHPPHEQFRGRARGWAGWGGGGPKPLCNCA
jgi:hypothetical protein